MSVKGYELNVTPIMQLFFIHFFSMYISMYRLCVYACIKAYTYVCNPPRKCTETFNDLVLECGGLYLTCPKYPKNLLPFVLGATSL